jgi:protein-tyrosine phosphatase
MSAAVPVSLDPSIADAVASVSAYVSHLSSVKRAFGYSLEAVVSPVCDWLLLGGRPTATLLEFRTPAHQRPVTHVINCLPLAEEPPIEAAFAPAGRLLTLGLQDDGDDARLRSALPLVIDFVRRAREADPTSVVYVHCQSGVNRAPAVAVAVLMAEEQLSLIAALNWVQKHRPAIRTKYIKEVALFEKQRFGTSSVPALLGGPDSTAMLDLYVSDLRNDYHPAAAEPFDSSICQ